MKLVPLLLVLAAACGGKLPETRYYQLATTASAPAPSAGRSGVVLAIQPLEADPAYDDERIVYRLNAYRLDYYNYHRWSTTPGTLVADFLERAFERSGRFRSVTRDTTAHAAPVTLGGRLVAIEEIDRSKAQWVGRIVVELQLTDTATGDVLWSEQFEETEPLPAQTPEGLAQAISKALDRIAQRALPQVADLAVATARANENAKAGSVSRAARLRP
jgi:ABC-type uncharacterized transport system auxiliary subunit